jgi:hypothetical protein
VTQSEREVGEQIEPVGFLLMGGYQFTDDRLKFRRIAKRQDETPLLTFRRDAP